MLKRINFIKQDFINLSSDQLRSDKEFEEAWRLIFWDLGRFLWPEPVANEGESAAQQDPEFYPRRLMFDEEGDRHE